MFRKRLLIAAALLWALGVGAGFRTLLVYSYTPGAQPPAGSAGRWPDRTILAPLNGRARLLVFVHPQCPCSQATVEELAGIMRGQRERLDAYVLFLAPRSERQDWIKSALWKESAAIQGVQVLADPDGSEARLFGAETSGQSFLYAPGGRLLFKGGITAARGHVGANAGVDAILALLEGDGRPLNSTPVFGCSLRNESGL